MFLAQNQKWYKQGKKYMSAKDFSVWLNNEYIPDNPDKAWIKDAYSKAVKQSLKNAHTAYTRFFKVRLNFLNLRKRERMTLKCILLEIIKRIVYVNVIE